MEIDSDLVQAIAQLAALVVAVGSPLAAYWAFRQQRQKQSNEREQVVAKAKSDAEALVYHNLSAQLRDCEQGRAVLEAAVNNLRNDRQQLYEEAVNLRVEVRTLRRELETSKTADDKKPLAGGDT